MIVTYTPRKALLLNREQDIVLCTKNTYGNNVGVLNSIIVQAKRGD